MSFRIALLLSLVLFALVPPIKGQDQILQGDLSVVKTDSIIAVYDEVDQFEIRGVEGYCHDRGSEGIPIKFKPTQLIAPLSLIAVGTIGYYWGDFHKLNRSVRNGIAHIRNGHYIHIDDWIQYIPTAGYLALGFYKNKRRLDFKERVAVEATAYLSMTALVNIAKYSFREKRPDSSARNSFPSGHTATAFTGAELIRSEFGWGIGSAAYVISTGVAFLRLYNDRHWLNDVIAGAGIGILSARIGYWMLPLYRKWFHWDKKENQACLVTVPSYSQGNLALNLLYLF